MQDYNSDHVRFLAKEVNSSHIKPFTHIHTQPKPIAIISLFMPTLNLNKLLGGIKLK